MRYLLDTNACIFLMKGNTDVLRNYLANKDFGIAVSSITVAELYYGVFNSEHVKKNGINLTNFLIGLQSIEFDSGAAMGYGRIRADLRKKGSLIGQMDMLIAAHAMSRSLILVTNNIDEFKRIDGLKYEDWLVKK